jgi:DNA-binding response OmpR family regulator
MIYIAVCDDEEYMSGQLCAKITDYFAEKKQYELKQAEIEVTQFLSGEALLQSDKPFDIIFLDIQMKSPDGMETAKRLRSADSKVF